MRAVSILFAAALATLTAATPTDQSSSSTLAERCTLNCKSGSEEFLNPATGRCSCVKTKGCTELCTVNLVDYTNPATGVCSCVPRCNITVTGLGTSTAADACPTGYNCVATGSGSTTTDSNGDIVDPGACVQAQACPTTCATGKVAYTDPATGQCSCVLSCPALQTGSSDGCPTGFDCLPANPSVDCDIAGRCARVCLADSCLSC